MRETRVRNGVAPLANDVAVTEPEEDLESLTVNELRALCKVRGLKTRGKKAVLIERLKG